MKKKRIISISIIAVLLAAIVAFAYTVTSDIAKSSVSSSNLRIELVMLEEAADGNQTEVTADTPILPGETKSRIAKVKNVGKEPAWVRVKADLVIGDETYWAGETPYSQLEGMDDGTNWTPDEDHIYWYYNRELKPGETTEPVFSGITLYASADNEIGGKDVNLKIDAEGTQVKHNGSTALEAKGWPEN